MLGRGTLEMTPGRPPDELVGVRDQPSPDLGERRRERLVAEPLPTKRLAISSWKVNLVLRHPAHASLHTRAAPGTSASPAPRRAGSTGRRGSGGRLAQPLVRLRSGQAERRVDALEQAESHAQLRANLDVCAIRPRRRFGQQIEVGERQRTVAHRVGDPRGRDPARLQLVDQLQAHRVPRAKRRCDIASPEDAELGELPHTRGGSARAPDDSFSVRPSSRRRRSASGQGRRRPAGGCSGPRSVGEVDDSVAVIWLARDAGRSSAPRRRKSGPNPCV